MINRKTTLAISRRRETDFDGHPNHRMRGTRRKSRRRRGAEKVMDKQRIEGVENSLILYIRS
jgi:hypothetical protein